MLRKPAGFWTKGVGLQVITAHVQGKATEAQAVEAVRAACKEAGVDEAVLTDSILLADVRWYARDVRKLLHLPGLREASAAAKARAEVAEQK